MSSNGQESQLPGSQFVFDGLESVSWDMGDLESLDESGKKVFWSRILNQVRIIHPVKIYAYLKEGRLVSIDNEELVIGFPKIYNFHRSRLEDISIKDEIARIIGKVIGFRVNIVFVAISGDSQNEISRELPSDYALLPENFLGEISLSNDGRAIEEHGGEHKRPMKERVMGNERARKILEVFEGRLVDTKKSI
jgi:hypothetical protein